MPIPLLALLAGAGLAGKVLQFGENRHANNASMEFQTMMYDRQRRDALEDRDYNSPINQMKRLEEAGLNPRLIYGSGSGSAAVTAVRSSSPGSYRAEPANLDGLADIFKDVITIAKTQAETSRVEAATRATEQDIRFNEETWFDRKQSIKDRNVLLETQQETELFRQAKIQWDTAYTAQKLDLDKQLSTENIRMVKQKIDQIVQQMDVTDSTKELLLERIKQAKFESKMNDIMLRGGTVSDVLKMLVSGIFRK